MLNDFIAAKTDYLFQRKYIFERKNGHFCARNAIV